MILDVVRAGWMNLRRDRAAMMLSFLVPIVDTTSSSFVPTAITLP